jgi:hypothetical protein
MAVLQDSLSPLKCALRARYGFLLEAKFSTSKKYSIFHRLSAIEPYGVLSMQSMGLSRMNSPSMISASSRFWRLNFAQTPRINGAKAWLGPSMVCISKAKILVKQPRTQNGTSLLAKTKALFFASPYAMHGVDLHSSISARYL